MTQFSSVTTRAEFCLGCRYRSAGQSPTLTLTPVSTSEAQDYCHHRHKSSYCHNGCREDGCLRLRLRPSLAGLAMKAVFQGDSDIPSRGVGLSRVLLHHQSQPNTRLVRSTPPLKCPRLAGLSPVAKGMGQLLPWCNVHNTHLRRDFCASMFYL